MQDRPKKRRLCFFPLPSFSYSYSYSNLSPGAKGSARARTQISEDKTFFHTPPKGLVPHSNMFDVTVLGWSGRAQARRGLLVPLATLSFVRLVPRMMHMGTD